MIIHLQENISVDNARKISSELEGKLIFNNENKLIITSSKTKSIDKKYEDFISEKFVLESDTPYKKPLEKPKKNLSYYYEFLLCKINYFFIKYIYNFKNKHKLIKQ